MRDSILVQVSSLIIASRELATKFAPNSLVQGNGLADHPSSSLCGVKDA